MPREGMGITFFWRVRTLNSTAKKKKTEGKGGKRESCKMKYALRKGKKNARTAKIITKGEKIMIDTTQKGKDEPKPQCALVTYNKKRAHEKKKGK